MLRKAKSLGVIEVSNKEAFITLPLVGEATEKHRFYYQINATTVEEKIEVQKGKSIEIPNRFIENQTYEVWIKRGRRNVFVKDSEGFNVFLLSVQLEQKTSLSTNFEHNKTIHFDTQINGYIIQINQHEIPTVFNNLFVMRQLGEAFYIPLTIGQDYQIIPTEDKIIIVIGWHLKGKILLI